MVLEKMVVMEVLVLMTERRLFAKGGEWLIGRLLWAFKYLCVGDRVHARHVEVAAVVRTLAPVGRHEARHPAAIWVAQGLALLRAVREQISTCTSGEGERREMEKVLEVASVSGTSKTVETKRKRKNADKHNSVRSICCKTLTVLYLCNLVFDSSSQDFLFELI